MDRRLDAAEDVTQALRHRLLAVRTVAVSFAAAVRSARRDLDVVPAERDALIERWRAWTIGALDRYAGEFDEAYRDEHRDIVEVRRLLTEELERAYRTVKEI